MVHVLLIELSGLKGHGIVRLGREFQHSVVVIKGNNSRWQVKTLKTCRST